MQNKPQPVGWDFYIDDHPAFRFFAFVIISIIPNSSCCLRAESLGQSWRSVCITSGSSVGCLTVSIIQPFITLTSSGVPLSNPASSSQWPFSVTAGIGRYFASLIEPTITTVCGCSCLWLMMCFSHNQLLLSWLWLAGLGC